MLLQYLLPLAFFSCVLSTRVDDASTSGDAIDICGAQKDKRKIIDNDMLEPIATTNRGQKEHWKHEKKFAHAGDSNKFPYHLPNEVLILCHKGSQIRGQVRTVKQNEGHYRAVNEEEAEDLFGTLIRNYVKSPERRTAPQDGNFLYVVDMDGNLLVAPVMQGNPPQEVKHGDLVPGFTPLSRPAPQPGAWGQDKLGDHAGGFYRGVARLGGEFDLVNETDQSWVIHQKSGYSLARIYPNAVVEFEMAHPELEENAVWENLGTGCFKTEPMMGVTQMERLRCYMHSAFGVKSKVSSSATCNFGSDAEAFAAQGNRPQIEHCTPMKTFATLCDQTPASGAGAELTLVEWLPPAESITCEFTADMMTQQLEHVEKLISSYTLMRGTKTDEEESQAEAAIATELRSLLRKLKRSPCWTSAEFARSARKGCPLSSCLGEEGMQSMFKLLVKTSAIPVEKAKNWWYSEEGNSVLSFWNARCKPESQTKEGG